MPQLLETTKLKSATNSALVHSVTIPFTFVDLKLCDALLILFTSAKILLPLCNTTHAVTASRLPLLSSLYPKACV